MAKTNDTKKAKPSPIPAKKKPLKKPKSEAKAKKQPPAPNPDSGSDSESDGLPRLLEPYTRDQLASLIIDAAAGSPSLYGHVLEVADRDATHRKIFVHGLPWEATRQTLASAFEPFGEIEECNVVTDRATGKTKGYGFVLFKTRKGAAKALREPQKRIGSRMASCQLASLGPAAKDPNAGAAPAAKKIVGMADAKMKSQGQAARGQLPAQQAPMQPLQPHLLAAVAAAQNMNLFSQHPSLNQMYGGLMASQTPGSYITPAVAGAHSHSYSGYGHSGFSQGMPATSQLSSGTTDGSLLGPYGTYGSSHGAASQQAQASGSQIGQQLVSSRNKGPAGGSLRGYKSYMWYENFLRDAFGVVLTVIPTVKCSEIEICFAPINLGRQILNILLPIAIEYSPMPEKKNLSFIGLNISQSYSSAKTKVKNVSFSEND